ncbi:MAG: hypothetical protein V1900_00015 [Candidatus Aenigmatarchaeota archaeon]
MAEENKGKNTKIEFTGVLSFVGNEMFDTAEGITPISKRRKMPIWGIGKKKDDDKNKDNGKQEASQAQPSVGQVPQSKAGTSGVDWDKLLGPYKNKKSGEDVEVLKYFSDMVKWLVSKENSMIVYQGLSEKNRMEALREGHIDRLYNTWYGKNNKKSAKINVPKLHTRLNGQFVEVGTEAYDTMTKDFSEYVKNTGNMEYSTWRVNRNLASGIYGTERGNVRVII